MIQKISLFAVLFFFSSLAALFALPPWEKIPEIPSSEEIQTLAVHPLDPEKILAASRSKIFEANPSGSFKDILPAYGRKLEIHRLLYFAGEPEALFILTSSGLFKSRLQNASWKKIYAASNPAQNTVLSLALDPEDPRHWFLGTGEGLLESDDAGKSWFRFPALRKDPVSDLQFVAKRLFVCARNGLYVSEDEAHFQMIFSLRSGNIPEDEHFQEEEDEKNSGKHTLNLHQILSGEKNRLWLATKDGVFESPDQGAHWQALGQSGLKTTEVRHLAYSGKMRQLFAGTAKGIYVYHPAQKRWQELFEGLGESEILGLAVTGADQETLFAATPSGIVHHALLPDNISFQESGWLPDKLDLFRELMRLEPSASEIQRAVVRYGNLQNKKTRNWQIGSRLSALLPTFSIGKDFSTANHVDLDRGGTNDPDRFIMGPEDISKKWGMNIGWDLGDFIYSSDQTSIDSREKLMVELRNDFVADATRIFYERRRLQMEIAMKPSVSEEERLGKLLRMDELTSLLDGMTGSYLSKQLDILYARHPELKELWEVTSHQTPEHQSPE